MKSYELEVRVVVNVEDEYDLLYTQETIMQNLVHMHKVMDAGVMCSYQIKEEGQWSAIQ